MPPGAMGPLSSTCLFRHAALSSARIIVLAKFASGRMMLGPGMVLGPGRGMRIAAG